VPISTALLPGPPHEHPDLLSHKVGIDCAGLFAAGQYWFRLGYDEAILRETELRFRRGDLLLLDADRRRFSREHEFDEQICAVRVAGEGRPIKLCQVSYFKGGDDHRQGLWASTFECPVPENELVREVTYRHFPNQEIHCQEETKRLLHTGYGRHFGELSDYQLEPVEQRITHADIVGVWTSIMRRA
jgi:hypothetical protein